MNWNKPVAVGLLSGCLSCMSLPAAAQSLDRREFKQQRRIEQGVRTGEITRKEYRHLERREAALARTEGRMRADGHLSHREGARLHRRLNHTSRAIHRDRHNYQEVAPAF